jgi:predicted phosphodiesterase
VGRVQLTRLAKQPALRWLGLLGIAVAVVVAGMLVGWRLAGESRTETAIGRVSFEVSPSVGGDAEAFIPVADWGFRADALDGPFRIRAELRSLHRNAALRAAEGERGILEAAEDDLRDGATRAVARAFLIGAIAALLLLGAITLGWRGLRPRWALLGVGAGFLAIAGGASLWLARSSFDAGALRSPTYFARGGELARILAVAEEERVRSGYGSTFSSILRSVTTVLSEVEEPGPPGRELYVASDLHGNALVIDPLSRLIGDAPVLLAGDFGQRGGEAESALLAPRVAALGTRVIAVSGNHDTRPLMQRLAGEGVTVLGAEGRLGGSGEYEGSPLLEVDGLIVAGFPDPLEDAGERPDDPDRPITFEQLPDGDDAFEDAASELLAWFRALPRPPDVVMVHQNALAQRLAEELWNEGEERALTIVTGHDHAQHLDRYGRIVVVDGGSVGAGGIFDAGREPIGFAQLHFAPTATTLRSVDLVEVEPFTGQARASRRVIAELCPDEERCSFEPPELDASASPVD